MVGVILWGGWCPVGAAGASGGANGGATSQNTIQPEREGAGPGEVLTDPEQDASAWNLAAEQLLDDPNGLRTIESVLAPRGLPGPRDAVLRAMASRASLPKAYLLSLQKLLSEEPDSRLLGLSAMSSIRSKAAARVLVEYTQAGQESLIRAAAGEALVRLTGHEPEGPGTDRWVGWYEAHEGLGREQWAELIAQGQARRADRAQRRSARETRQILGLYGRLIEQLPEDERASVIAEMLLAPQPSVRRAGVERAGLQHAIGGQPLGEQVERAIIRLVGSSDASARRDAAELALTIGADATADAVVGAVRIEQDAEVAEVMLHTAARWPCPELVEPVLTWLAAGGSTRAAAAEAATALSAGGLLDEAARGWIGELLRRADIDDLQEVELGLLVSVGNDEDLERVGELLASPDHPSRLAAAQALLLRPEGVDRLIMAARTDSTFVPLASDAILTHRPTAGGLEDLLSLRAQGDPTAEIKRLARSLPIDVLLSVAGIESRSADERVLLLDDVPAREVTPETERQRGEGVVLLAEAYLALGEPAGALRALGAMQPAEEGGPGESLTAERALRTRALVWLDRLDEAEQLGAPEDVWLRALEDVRAEPHAPEVEALIESLFRVTEQPTPEAPAGEGEATPPDPEGEPG